MKMRAKMIAAGCVCFGLAGGAFANFRDFKETGAGTDDQWSTLANWTQGFFPTSADTARIEKNGRIADGITGTAGKVSIAGFGADASLYVDAGGTLQVGSAGIEVAFSRKAGLLDISGTLTSSGAILMGTAATHAPTATINFNPGSSSTFAGLTMGSTTNAGIYTVNQIGGNVQMSGEIIIGDVNDAKCSATYTISGGTLLAARLNIGGNGTSTAKFTVNGSSSDISFSSQSWLTGKTELEFIFDAAGVSALMMTNGGYTAASTVSLTVDTSAFTGSFGNGIKLIGVDDVTDSLAQFNTNNVSITSGYTLDYRAGDGLYLIPEPGTIGLLVISGIGLFFVRRHLG